MSSIWQLSFEKGAASSRDVSIAMKIKQDPTSPADFHTISIYFIQSIYKSSTDSIPMTVSWICSLYEFEFLTGWGKNHIFLYIGIYLLGRQLWLISKRRSYRASREEPISVYILQWHSTSFLRNVQQLNHLHYSLHISWLLSNH